MTDEFLIRLDEEMPSDERYAVKLIETQVLSEDHRNKIELLIDKVDKLALTANVDVLDEIKNILSGMLESLRNVNKKYAFISEMVLKLDDKMETARQVDFTSLSSSVIEANDRLRNLSEDLAPLLVDIQTSLSSLERKYNALDTSVGENAERIQRAISKLSEDMDERIRDLSISEDMENINTALGSLKSKYDVISGTMEKLDEKAGGLDEKLGGLDEKVGASLLSFNDMGLEISSIKNRHDDQGRRIGERLDALEKTLDSVHEKLSDMQGRAEKISESLPEISLLSKDMDEKISNVSVSTVEAIDKFDEKLNQIYMSYSETVNSLEDKINRLVDSALSEVKEKLVSSEESIKHIVKNHAAILEGLKSEIEEKLDNIPAMDLSAIGRLEERIERISESTAEAVEKTEERFSHMAKEQAAALVSGIEEKTGELSVATAEIAAKIDEKLNDLYISNSHHLERLESKVGELSVSIAETAAKLDAESPGISSVELESSNERLAKSVRGLQDDIDSLKTQVKAYSDDILSALAKPTTRKKKRSRKRAVAKPKRRVVRRRARTARRAPRRLRKRRKAVQDEALDVLIVNTLNNVSMNMDSLKKATNVSEKRLRDRLNILMTRGVVTKEKRGRSVFYISHAVETAL